MYNKKRKWGSPFFKGQFFAGMIVNQRCEAMNSYLKPFLHYRLTIYDFLEKIEMAVAQIRHNESHDDYNFTRGLPLFRTHLKQIEQHAGRIFTRAIFNKIRERILKEGANTVKAPMHLSGRHIYTLSAYPNFVHDYEVIFYVDDNRIECECTGFEGNGMPCTHALTVMKLESLTEIPENLISPRWQINAKSVQGLPISNNYYNVDEYSEQARFGALVGHLNGICYCRSKSVEGFNMALNQMQEVSKDLEEILEKETNGGTNSTTPVTENVPIIRDPVIVKSKGAPPTQRGQTRAKNRCKYCKQTGHNSQTCPEKLNNE